MLIEIVRRGIFQCFCHTCVIPEKPAFSTDKGVNESKKTHFISTEIRCQEKTRGGVCYEVILADPVTSLKQRVIPVAKNETSFEEIEQKLRAAEERRIRLESTKLATINAKMVKIEEASRKRNEQTNIFINQTKKALEKKLKSHGEKREAFIADLKLKMKDHIENVEEARQFLEAQTQEIRNAIDEKLKTASAQRDENLKRILNRLREHEEQVERIRIINAGKFWHLDQNIQKKLREAKSRKDSIDLENFEKFELSKRRAELVRQNKASNSLNNSPNMVPDSRLTASSAKEMGELTTITI